MMHQPIEKRARDFISTFENIVSQLDLIQATLLLRNLGKLDEVQFVVVGSKTTDSIFSTSLSGLCRSPSNALRPLSSILILFEGGPTEHVQFKASLAAFVADRLLMCIKLYGKERVCREINDVIEWKSEPPPWDEEKDDTWDELAAFERYAG